MLTWKGNATMRLLWAVAGATLAVVQSASAQGWEDWQNISICTWSGFRANIIRDTIYLDGGVIWDLPGLTDGQNGGIVINENPQALMYAFNLGQPFNQSTNLTGLFQGMSKTGGYAANNIAPNYVDGVMFANEGELILYGGLYSFTNASSEPAANTILSYEAYQYGTDRPQWSPGFVQENLPTNMTRYITNGAGVSSISESLGFYFSGMRGEDWGPIYDSDGSADTLADSLITVNMTVMGDEAWSNDTLQGIPPRANAELVWLPVAEQGVLVAIGGVIDPNILIPDLTLNNSQASASRNISPTFMETVALYDVAGKKWYQQNTTGDTPPQLTLFCSVVGVAQDRSSFNIYIWGGYNGINDTSNPSDDVYILSVPQFVWTHAYTGQSGHGRAEHKCFAPYPDQMMIIGGLYQNNPEICLPVIEIFNLNTLAFQDTYDPRNWNEYQVPSKVIANIGGNANGSATVTSPKTSWGDSALSSLFTAQYTKTIPTYYPYKLVTPNATSTSTPTSTPPVTITGGGGGLPTWVGPVLGVVLGLIVVSAAIILFLLWRRRRGRRARGTSDTQDSSVSGKGFVYRWLHGTAAQDTRSSGKGLTELGGDDDDTTVVSTTRNARHVSEAGSMDIYELAARDPPRHEMAGEINSSSPPSHSSWSQPQFSPGLVSPNIEELMELDATSSTPTSATGPIGKRPTLAHARRISDRSDETAVSELASPDFVRPPHSRHLSDNSVSDSHSVTAVSESNSTSIQSEDRQILSPTPTRIERIQTLHEVDEPDSPRRAARITNPSELDALRPTELE